MREFQDRRRIRRLLHSRYAIGALVVVLALSIEAVWGIYSKYGKSEELAARMEANLAELQTRKQRLEGLNASLETSEGKEREIRERFGVVREGERTIIIVDEAGADDGVTPIAPRGWWGAFLAGFR